jgi:ABC-type multidrug transport system fused ATPase/permease subunit
MFLEFHLMTGSRILSIAVLMCVVTPWLMVLLVPLAAFYIRTCRYYAHTARDCQRLVALSTSPIFAFFSETLDGLDTIRVYQQQHVFRQIFVDRLRDNCRAIYTKVVADVWLDQRLGSVGCCIVGGSSLLMVAHRDSINPTAAGLALAQAVSMLDVLRFSVKSFVEVESIMNAVDRLNEYATALPLERPKKLAEDAELAADWPQHGKLEITNLTMCYREGLEPALVDMTAVVFAREKVGPGTHSQRFALFHSAIHFNLAICKLQCNQN